MSVVIVFDLTKEQYESRKQKPTSVTLPGREGQEELKVSAIVKDEKEATKVVDEKKIVYPLMAVIPMQIRGTDGPLFKWWLVTKHDGKKSRLELWKMSTQDAFAMFHPLRQGNVIMDCTLINSSIVRLN